MNIGVGFPQGTMIFIFPKTNFYHWIAGPPNTQPPGGYGV